ncbi:MAG: thioesterase [Pseudomonadota bacterium]
MSASIVISDFVKVGLTQSREEQVVKAMTVGALVEGMPYVYSTPYMIQVMEVVAENLTAPLLPKGWVSVGTRVDVKHLKATPLDFTVTTTAEVVGVTDKAIHYKVSAHDGIELVGEGVHYRGVVQLTRFEAGMAKKSGIRE